MPINFKEGIVVITSHLCNKNCLECGIRIHESDFGFIDLAVTRQIISRMPLHDRLVVPRIILSGGEPLLHPRIDELTMMLAEKFRHAKILITTNGLLMERWYSKISDTFHDLVRFRISEYPDWNDEIVNDYRNQPNVDIEPWRGFMDYKLNVEFTDAKSRTIWKTCANQHLMLKGERLYPCCTSETIERIYSQHRINAHVIVTENWLSDIQNLNHSQACKYCWWYAGNTLRTKDHKQVKEI